MASAPPIGRFPKAQRLRKRSEFTRTQSGGTRVVTPRFVFLFRRREGVGDCRLGITASRKVGNAVVRNRAKRLVREAFRSTRQLWSPGLDMVVIVRSDPKDARLEDVVQEWRRALPSFVKRGVARPAAEARA